MYLKYAVFAVAALAPLGAADFWQDKKFTEWNERQVRRVLEDSPWARSVTVPDDGGRSRRGSRAIGPAKAGKTSPTAPPEAPPVVNAILRWHTALPVKQAVARMRFGDAAETSPEAARILGREEKNYVLGVTNLPASVLDGALQKSNFRIKLKGKQDIEAADVQPESQGRRVNLFLFFPRYAGGAPLIDIDDGEMEVQLSVGDVKISRKFKLKEMLFGGKLEI